jgi:hypothetical protein
MTNLELCKKDLTDAVSSQEGPIGGLEAFILGVVVGGVTVALVKR